MCGCVSRYEHIFLSHLILPSSSAVVVFTAPGHLQLRIELHFLWKTSSSLGLPQDIPIVCFYSICAFAFLVAQTMYYRSRHHFRSIYTCMQTNAEPGSKASASATHIKRYLLIAAKSDGYEENRSNPAGCTGTTVRCNTIAHCQPYQIIWSTIKMVPFVWPPMRSNHFSWHRAAPRAPEWRWQHCMATERHKEKER